MQPFTREDALALVDDLAAAFPGRRSADDLKRMARVWYDTLSDLPGDSIKWAKKRAIQEENYFPKVATIRAHAQRHVEFNRRQQLEAMPKIDDPMYCNGCRARRRLVTQYRPLTGWKENGERDFRAWLVTADGQWLLLEAYDAERCECKEHVQYEPTEGIDPLAMPIGDVGMQWYQVRRTSTMVKRMAVSA